MITTTTYEQKDYFAQKDEIDNMSLSNLITALDEVDAEALPAYSYTGSLDDFRNHRVHMIMYRVLDILSNADKRYKVVEIS